MLSLVWNLSLLCLCRCQRCLGLVRSHTVRVALQITVTVSSQWPEDLCLPLLEATRTPLHTCAQLHTGGRGGRLCEFGGTCHLKIPDLKNKLNFLKLPLSLFHKQIYNTAAVDRHPRMCVRVRKKRCAFTWKMSSCQPFHLPIVILAFIHFCSFLYKAATISPAPSPRVSHTHCIFLKEIDDLRITRWERLLNSSCLSQINLTWSFWGNRLVPSIFFK